VKIQNDSTPPLILFPSPSQMLKYYYITITDSVGYSNELFTQKAQGLRIGVELQNSFKILPPVWRDNSGCFVQYVRPSCCNCSYCSSLLICNSQPCQAVATLEKFEQIKGIELDLWDKYMKALLQFGKEVEIAKKLYEKHKEDPPIPRNMPPVYSRFLLLGWTSPELLQHCLLLS